LALQLASTTDRPGKLQRVITARADIAEFLEKHARWSEACAAYRDVLAMYDKLRLPPNADKAMREAFVAQHAIYLHNAALCLRRNGELKEAESNLRSALQKLEQVTSQRHDRLVTVQTGTWAKVEATAHSAQNAPLSSARSQLFCR